jgi:hypothetical protein
MSTCPPGGTLSHGIMRSEGKNTYRKGREKLERKVKERLRKEKEDGDKKE